MNISLQQELDKIATLMDITEYQIYNVRDAFYDDMYEKDMIKMLHTYTFCNLDIPKGEYLSIDFGGSNIRCNLFSVDNKQIALIKNIAFSLVTEEYDYTTSEYSLKDIMGVIVDKLETIIDKDKEYFLGHTFSFATRSLSKKSAIIIKMAKGFNLKDAENTDVNEVLFKIIKERNLKIEPMSIINDTTATLLTGNYFNQTADIAVIMGTGHNACFQSETGEIINIESAFFSRDIPLSYYDLSLLDKLPDCKCTQLEFLTGGKYLGMIAQEIVDELHISGFLKNKLQITSKILSDAVDNQLSEEFSLEEREVLKQIGIILFKRTAKLVVSEIMGILKYIDEDLDKKHCIIFDGTVYEKNKVIQEYISMYLDEVYNKKAENIETKLIKDASAVGAVISIFPLN